MKHSELAVGMKFVFIPGIIDLSVLNEENYFTIVKIENDHCIKYTTHSNNQEIYEGEWNKIWVLLPDNTFEQIVHSEENQCDALDQIFNRQTKFNMNFFIPQKLSIEEKQQKTKDFVIHLTRECMEVLDEIDWKMHKSKTTSLNREHILEECIDVFKFLLGIFYIWEFNSNDFKLMFHQKSETVEKRFEDSKK